MVIDSFVDVILDFAIKLYALWLNFKKEKLFCLKDINCEIISCFAFMHVFLLCS